MQRFILIFVLTLVAGFYAEAQDISSLQISSNYNGTPENYCGDSIYVLPQLTITGTTAQSGFKISLTNFVSGEDQLVYGGKNSAVVASWDSSTGSLIVSGNLSTTEFQDAIRLVYYKNQKAKPTEGKRSVSISLADADYLPYTGHFYQYVSSPGITWTTARAQAANKTLYGLKGYLATITSKNENDFIWTKTKGVGWIGASDAESEGIWKWVTGPETGTVFWEGNETGHPASSQYSNWNEGEPNNSGDEDYAHITYNVGIVGSWNDLSNTGATSPSDTYYPRGYLVEYGGTAGEQTPKLMDYTEINVVYFTFSSELEHTICQYESVKLNHEFIGNYTWSPETGLDNAYIASPLASPMQTTSYQVTAQLGSCVKKEIFKVNVKPSPVVELGNNLDICDGAKVTLDAGDQLSYLWNTGETTRRIVANKDMWYKVRVGNSYNCYREDSMHLIVHKYPLYSLDKSDTLICGQFEGTLRITQDNGSVVWSPLDNAMSIVQPNSSKTEMKVLHYGNYKVGVQVKDPYGCEKKDTLKVGFFQVPTSVFSIDSTKCYHYNLNVNYEGNATPAALYTWVFIDTTSSVGLMSLEIPLGINDRINRDLSLTVSEDGCKSDKSVKHIRVIPNMEIWADTTDNCQPFEVHLHQKTTEVINNYEWTFSDGRMTNDPNPVITFYNSGFYDVRLKITSDEGCENSVLMKEMIKVRPIPSIATNLDPSICFSDTITVVYTGNGSPQASYTWDLSSLNSSEIVTYPGIGQGPFKISIRNKPVSQIGLSVMSEYNCKSSKRIFPFKRKPWFGTESDKYEGCPPLEVTMKAVPIDPVDQLSYRWDLGDSGFVDGTAEMKKSYTEPNSVYNIQTAAKSTITGCADTVKLPFPITVYPIPTAEFEPDTPMVSIVHPIFNFENKSEGAVSYYWDFGDTLGVSQEINPQYEYKKLGYFDVKLIAQSELSCLDSISHTVTVAFEKLFPPTAFSPNSSNEENRVFRLMADGINEDGYHLQIFNRWGQVIFECENKAEAWDGTMKNGQPAPTGAYVWVLTYVDFLKKSHKQSGTVTLLY